MQQIIKSYAIMYLMKRAGSNETCEDYIAIWHRFYQIKAKYNSLM